VIKILSVCPTYEASQLRQLNLYTTLEPEKVGKISFCTFINLFNLLKQEKANLQKEIFLKYWVK